MTAIKPKNKSKQESEDENFISPFINTSLTGDRGQTHFCLNLITNLFERGTRPCKAEFPKVKITRQIIDHYLKGICQGTSPVQTSKHAFVRHEIAIFSEYLDTIRKNLTSNEVSPNDKHDLQKILACFIIDYFTHIKLLLKKNVAHRIVTLLKDAIVQPSHHKHFILQVCELQKILKL